MFLGPGFIFAGSLISSFICFHSLHVCGFILYMSDSKNDTTVLGFAMSFSDFTFGSGCSNTFIESHCLWSLKILLIC